MFEQIIRYESKYNNNQINKYFNKVKMKHYIKNIRFNLTLKDFPNQKFKDYNIANNYTIIYNMETDNISCFIGSNTFKSKSISRVEKDKLNSFFENVLKHNFLEDYELLKLL